MEELEAIARQKGLSVNQLVTEIDSKREHENLSSAIRIYILNHLKKNKSRKLSPGFVFTNFAEKDNILSPPMKAVHQ